MVENQHSINTILSFGAKSVDPIILEQLLVGRDKTAKYLFDAIENIVENGLNQHILIVGQRGMGKTHLLRVLFHRSQPYIEKEKLVVAYFSEEEYGVSSHFDFLIRILYAFIRWNEQDKVELEGKLEKLQNTSFSEQTQFAEQIIKDYIKDTPLLILTENFGDILNAIGAKEQGKLRSWLYDNKRISIIATSQAMSQDFDREDRPFYGFFNLYYLKTLTYKDSFNFLTSLARIDGRQDVVEHLSKRGKAQVRAIHDLVKGNHRLLVTFYEFLKSDTLARLSNHFIKTINDLKPYYETFIRYLPPLQQKVMRYIALSRKPQQGSDIARNCFIEQNSLSKQLSELARKKLIEVIIDKNDKRNRLYDINEPLLRISIEVGEHKEGITALFIDFLTLYYDESELKTKINKFSDLMEACQTPQERQEFEYEISAIERALTTKVPGQINYVQLRRVLREVKTALKEQDIPKAISCLENEISNPLINNSKHSYEKFLITLYSLDYRFEDVIRILEGFSYKEVSEANYFGYWGYALAKLAQKGRSEELFTRAIEKFEIAEKNGEDLSLQLTEFGHSLIELGMIKDDDEYIAKGYEKLKFAFSVDPNEIAILLQLGYTNFSLALYKQDSSYTQKGMVYFEKANKLQPEAMHILRMWGASIALTVNLLDVPKEGIKKFYDAFNLYGIEKRRELWKIFAAITRPELMIILQKILIADVKKESAELSPVIVEWITNILGSLNSKPDEKLLKSLRGFIAKAIKIVPELEISALYINTYEQYHIKGNKNAVLDLPKEQRLFFIDHILKDT